MSRISSGAAPASISRRRVRPSEMILVTPTMVKARARTKAIGTSVAVPNIVEPSVPEPRGIRRKSARLVPEAPPNGSRLSCGADAGGGPEDWDLQQAAWGTNAILLQTGRR